MLQFVTYKADADTMVEQAVKAIEGGCRWVELRADGVTEGDRAEAIRLAAEGLIPLCRGKNIFLMLNNHPELTAELEVQGVHLEAGGMTAREAREKLGGGPVIGVTVTSPREAVELLRRDVDYVRVNVSSPEEVTPYVEAIKAAGGKLPVVASGAIDASNIAAYLAAGASGVAVSEAIATAADPVLAATGMLNVEC